MPRRAAGPLLPSPSGRGVGGEGDSRAGPPPRLEFRPPRRCSRPMNNPATAPVADATPMAHALAELERRVGVLEAVVQALPDAKQIEERVAERVQANLPPPIDPTAPPSFKDIELP